MRKGIFLLLKFFDLFIVELSAFYVTVIGTFPYITGAKLVWAILEVAQHVVTWTV